MANSSVRTDIPLVRVVPAFLAMYFIWGSTYLAIRFGIETIPPFLMIGSRFMIGGLALYLFARRRGAPKPSLREWRNAAIPGILMLAGGTGLVAYAEQWVPSGLTALLVATVPLWIVMMDWVRPNGFRPGIVTVSGLALGFAGVALLLSPGFSNSEPVNLYGGLMIMLATMLWAAGSLASRHTVDSHPLSGMAMRMITGAAVLIVGSGLLGEWSQFSLIAVTLKSWLALWYQIIFGTTAFIAYLWLLKVSTPAKAATYAYVNPAVALILGAVLADELLSLQIGVASLVIIIAVAIIVTRKQKPAAETKPSCPDSEIKRAAWLTRR